MSNILIIDDNEGIIHAIATRLTAEGHVCIPAQNGKQGLSDVMFGDIGVVVTDLNMPGMDGVEMINHVRRFSQVPIVVITGEREAYDASLRALSKDPSITVLEKPLPMGRLIEIVNRKLAKAA